MLLENRRGVSYLAESKNSALSEHRVERLRALWRRRVFLFRMAGGGLLTATAIAFLIPARYESTVRLIPPDVQSGGMLAALANKAGGGLAAFGGDMPSLKTSGALFMGILQSRTVEDDLIGKFDLRRVHSTQRWESARNELANSTEVSEDRKSGIITIKVTDRKPQLAASLCQEYVEELNSVVNQLSTSSAHRERVFLEERLKAVQLELADAEKEFSQFASINSTIDIKEQSRAMVDAAAALQGQLIAAQSELQGLRQIYADTNVRVRSIHARISELQKQLGKIGGQGESSTAVIKIRGESFYPSIRELPLLGVTYADLYRRSKIQEVIYETLTQEYELAKVEEAKEIPSIRILDPANVPERKAFPPRLLIMFLGVCGSCALGVGWVFGREAWKEADAHDPRKLFAQEIFAAMKAELPVVSQNGSGLRGLKKRLLNRTHLRGEHREA
jgi:capsule polysaccharide export protein KpsE/RkpR